MGNDSGGGPTDAAPDTFMCALYGQSCTQASDCCNGIPCSVGGLSQCSGQASCTCTDILH
jgi:hypothetical protein